MTADRRTIDLYTEKAADYAARFQSGEPRPRLEAFIDALPEGGHALDLGCGTGSAAARMRDRGLTVTAIDASPGMADLARDRFGLEVTVATFDELSGDALYDGVWASFSLLHAPREDMPGHLAAIHRALKPNGRFVIGLKTGTGTHRDALGRRYTYYTEDELMGLLQAAGFTPERTETGSGKGLDGTVAPWIVMTAHA
jgi:ubiquinone/menaquinone biosynthesis C-methylase UbiE